MDLKKLKDEAVMRMKLGGICNTAIEDFKNNDIITIADNGILRNITVAEAKKLREIQKQTNNDYLIYHIVFTSNENEGIYFYLSVSDFENYWRAEQLGISTDLRFSCLIEYTTPKGIDKKAQPPFPIADSLEPLYNLNGVLYAIL